MPSKPAYLNLDSTSTLPSSNSVQAESDSQKEEGEIDELLKEVQKELHTRFKNMFEGEMLLPNLANNPEFEGKPEANLLSLEDGEKTAKNNNQK